jgi:hypothetical protein
MGKVQVAAAFAAVLLLAAEAASAASAQTSPSNPQMPASSPNPVSTLSAPGTLSAPSIPGTPSGANAPGQHTVGTGTSINAALSSQDINTKNAKVGDPFTMIVVPPNPNGDPAFDNAVIHGHVASAVSAGQGRKPQLQLWFDSITFEDGQAEPMSGAVLRMQTTRENTTVKKALGAGAGMGVGSQSIGRIIGGDAGAVVGMLGGAVTGFLFAANNKANFSVVHGTNVTIQMMSTLEVPRRQSTR